MSSWNTSFAGDDVIVEFDYRAEDLKEAQRAHLKSLMLGRAGGRLKIARGIFGWVLFVALMVMLFIFLNRNSPKPATTQPTIDVSETLLDLVPWLLIFFFIWFVIFRILRGGVSKRQWNSTPAFQLHKRLVADDDHVAIDDVETSLTMKWSAIKKFSETANLFLLFIGDYNYYIVPRRAFTPLTEVEFRRLLAQKIQPQTKAFPVLQATPLPPLPMPPLPPAAPPPQNSRP